MLTVQLLESTRGQRIRDEFAAIGGGMTTAEFAQHCIDAGIWTDHELGTFALRAAQAEVRRELKALDAVGLPFAGKTAENTDDGAPIWRQRSFWRPTDYAVNIIDLRGKADTMNYQADAMESECIKRYGIVPFSGSAA
jgi:hypothetical protein